MRLGLAWFIGMACVVGLRAADSSEAIADKSSYTLLNPTPRDLMREMATDRPDVTESPYTVDTGHFQVEADIVKFSYDRYNSAPNNTRIESLSIAALNLKVGLCNSTDLQLVVPTYNSLRTRSTKFFPTPSGGKARVDRDVTDRGFGDMQTRLKWNVWGNDGGETALALMPYVNWPTAPSHLGNGSVEGGLIVPFCAELPAGWALGSIAEFDLLSDSDGHGEHGEFLNTISFSRDIMGDLGGYVEFVSVLTTESHAPWMATANIGFTYALTPDIQLDAGVNIGVTRSADDITAFTGISFRY